MTTLDAVGGHRIPGFVDGSLVASLHRRAAEAALLRDRRLELEIGHGGEQQLRMVQGVRSAGQPGVACGARGDGQASGGGTGTRGQSEAFGGKISG